MRMYTFLEDGKHKADQLVLTNSEDVTVVNPATGEVLTWDGTKWINIEVPPPDEIDGGTFV